MSFLEKKKLVRIIDSDFVMPEASDSWYDVLVVDQRAANSLIRISLKESVTSQYQLSSIDQVP